MHIRRTPRAAGLPLLASLICLSVTGVPRSAGADNREGPPAPEKYLALLERVWAGLDMTELDLDAAASAAGATPRTALEWVARRTRYEPYAGILRGAAGALQSGAGNSSDRALLVAAIVARQGRSVRFAQATLSTEAAEKLVRGCLQPGAPEAAGTSLAAEVRDRAAEQFVILGDALHDAGVHAPGPDAAAWNETIATARAHAWVEVEENGSWIALDPTPGAAYGEPLAAAELTSDTLPAGSEHRVTLSLVAELTEGGKRRAETLLEETRSAASLFGVSIALHFESSANAATPLLFTGATRLKGKSIPTTGGAQGGDFLPLPGLGRALPSPVTGLWLRFAIEGPERRGNAECVLFDAVGAAARGGKGEAPKEPLPLAEAVEAVYGVAIAGGYPNSQAPLSVFTSVADPLSPAGAARLLGAVALDYLAARARVPATLLDPPAAAFVDSPNIVVTRARVRGSAPGVELAMDLTRRAVRLARAPEDPLSQDGLFFDRLSSAILDHTLERAVVGDGEMDRSTGGLVEAAHAEGIPLVRLAPAAGGSNAPLGRDGAALAAAEVARGRVVMLPAAVPPGAQAGRLGWWSVDPRTGDAHDAGEDGWRQAATDRAVQERENIKNRQLACIYGLKVIIKVVVPMVALWGGLPPETVQLLDDLKIEEVLELAEKRACGTTGPKRIDRLPPGDKRFPPRPPNARNPAPNQNKNPPMIRWPRGAPRGR